MRLISLPFAILVFVGTALGLVISGLPASITLAVLGGAFLLCAVFMYPVAVIWILLGAVPFNFLWVGVGITAPEVIYSLAFVALAVSWVIKKIIRLGVTGKAESLASPITPPLAVFLCVVMLSVVIGIFRGHKFFHWGSDLNAFMYYGLCFISLDLIKEKKKIGRLFIFMVISSVLGLIYGIYTGLTRPYPEMEILGHGYVRFSQASEIGLLMLIMSVAAAVILARGAKKNIFIWLSLFFAVMQVASFVRSRWIAAVFALAFLFFIIAGKQRLNFLKLALTAVLLVSLYLSFAISLPSDNILFRPITAIEKRYESIFTAKEEPSVMTRDSEWREAWREALRYPVLGNGLGTPVTYFRYDKWFGTQTWDTTRYIHNAYLYVFLNMGLAGLLSFLWLLFSFIRYGLKIYSSSDNESDRAFGLGAGCAAMALMTASMAGPLITSPVLTMWLGFLMGALIIIDRSNKKA